MADPSSVVALGEKVEVVEIGKGVGAIADGADPQALGEAVHGFFAADDEAHSREARVAFAEAVLRRWGVRGDELAEGLVDAADALRAFVARRWPGGVVHREMPVWCGVGVGVGGGGTVLRGAADLVVELAGDGASEWAVVDDKATLGSVERCVADAVYYGGQLVAYAEAIEVATGGVVVRRWIHLPLVGRVVRLG